MMKRVKITILIIAIVAIFTDLEAQKLISKNAHIWFYSHTPLEDIEAHNHQVVSILDPSAGVIQFSLLVRSFEFDRKLMEEHFNENYMESDSYPKASFKGKISNMKDINLKKEGSYTADITGDLTIHNVTRNFNGKATITVKGKTVSAKSDFVVRPEDYNIEIPKLVEDKIAKEMDVHVEVSYD
jgi:polyisoprenoid-binding protein YceI